MTRCDPSSWSRRRLLRGLGLLALTFAAASLVARSWFAGVLAIVLVVVLDAFAAILLGRLRPVSLRASVRQRRHGAFGVVLVGDTATLDVAFGAEAPPAGSVLVTPVLPAGLEPDGEAGVVVRPADLDAPETSATFPIRAVHAGTHVLPGFLVRQASPLGLFVNERGLEARFAVQVLPDFVTTRDAALSSLFRRAFRVDQSGPRRIKGGGGDFHELREYTSSDPIHRIDWKATARRGEMFVREYEEPPEIRMDVILDASLDMTHDSNERSRFHAASSLVCRLACAAVVRQMTLRLTAYDDSIVLDTTLAPGHSGCLRMATRVADLSHDAVVRRARALLSNPHMHPNLLPRLDAVRRAWRPAALSLPLRNSAELEPEADFAASIAASAVRDEGLRCPTCGLRVFAEEAECPRCVKPLGQDGLSPRAATLAAILARARARRGPGFLFLISSLQGGEPCDRIADMLAHTASSGRAVHVVAPGLRRFEFAHPVPIGSIVHGGDRADVLAEIHRVGSAVRLRQFARRLQDARVRWHEIGDDSDLEELVSEAMMCRV